MGSSIKILGGEILCCFILNNQFSCLSRIRCLSHSLSSLWNEHYSDFVPISVDQLHADLPEDPPEVLESRRSGPKRRGAHGSAVCAAAAERSQWCLFWEPTNLCVVRKAPNTSMREVAGLMVLTGGFHFLEPLVVREENKKWEELGLMSSNKQCNNYFAIHIVPYMILMILIDYDTTQMGYGCWTIKDWDEGFKGHTTMFLICSWMMIRMIFSTKEVWYEITVSLANRLEMPVDSFKKELHQSSKAHSPTNTRECFTPNSPYI